MMMAKEYTFDGAKKPMAMHPKKFALWLFLVTVIMVFAALTSYYIVRRAEGNWLKFDMPQSFFVNTAIILLSSATMHWAFYSAKKDNLNHLKWSTLITTVLGIAFLVGQFLSWGDLVDQKVFFAGSQSNAHGSILYVLSGLHGLHVVGGVLFLIVVLFNTFSLKIHSKNMVQIEMCATYWHFLDALWVYLFVFLLLNS